jgi:hypothetical protein
MVGSNPKWVEGAFLTRIKNAANFFITKYHHLLDIDTEKTKNEFDSKNTASEIMDTLLSYCWSRKQKLCVIIDEYDNFANTILSDSGEAEYRAITHGEGFLRSFFNVIKAGTSGSDKTGTVKKNWIWAKVGANNYSPLQRFPGGDRREGDMPVFSLVR